jgi:hypothetical protein
MVKATGPEIVQPDHLRMGDPTLERLARCLGNLEADRLAPLARGDGGALLHPSGGEHVPDLQTDEVAATQLAVDCRVERREVAPVVGHLEPQAN